MNHPISRPRHFAHPLSRTLALAMLLLALPPARAMAASYAPFPARSGLDIATAAAHAWSEDAVLVYVENDEALDTHGTAERWGYLFHSPSANKARVYSIRDGKILVAEPLDMKFEAPPLALQWIDSGAALEVAENAAGAEYRRQHDGEASAMLLMRGAFDDEHPDRSTWTILYTSPTSPSLFVVVDAATGKLRRTWRG